MKRKFSWLTVPGLLLLMAGLIGLYSGPEISQYVFLPGGEGTKYGELLSETEKKWEGSIPAGSLHGLVSGVSLTAGNRSEGEVTLYETMGGFFETYPRRFRTGRPLTRGDAGKRVIVLDEGLGFALFGGDRDPVGERVRIGDREFEIVGIAAHGRRIGEEGKYAAWIPLDAEGAPAPETVILSAGGRMGAGLRTVFETTAREAFGAGQAFFLGKERMRGIILPGAAALILAVRLLAVWFRKTGEWIRKWVRDLREKLKRKYPRQMAGTLAGRGLQILLAAAAPVAACALLVWWASRPMTVFPEWVPESLVDPEAVVKRFWELTSAAARTVQFRTPELAEIRFWSGAVRWGLVLTLLSRILHHLRGKGRREEKRPDAV